MKNYIFNEKTYIEGFLNGEEIEKNTSIRYIISLLFRYYSIYKADEISSRQIKNKIVDDLLKNGKLTENMQDFEVESIVKNVIAKQKKYFRDNGEYKPLKQLEYVPLYSSEFDFIETLETDQEKKFMFTCYILARFYDTSWVNSSDSEIFKLANISKTQHDRNLFIGKLWREGKIGLSSYVSNNALKIQQVKKDDDEIVIKVYKMEKLGNTYLAYIKPNYKQCEKCGKLIKIKSKNDGRTKYCTICRKKVDSQLVMESRNKEKQLREVQVSKPL